MFTDYKPYGKIHLMFKFRRGDIGGVNKKVDKKIIFIMKIRGVVEGLYLKIKKYAEVKNHLVINIYFGGAN